MPKEKIMKGQDAIGVVAEATEIASDTNKIKVAEPKFCDINGAGFSSPEKSYADRYRVGEKVELNRDPVAPGKNDKKIKMKIIATEEVYHEYRCSEDQYPPKEVKIRELGKIDPERIIDRNNSNGCIIL